MKKNRFIRRAALVTCAGVLGAFAYAPSASSHIGSSHAQVVTTDADLVSATILSDGATVQACFDAAIGTVNDSTQFEAVGYDTEVQFNFPAAAPIDPANNKCVNLAGGGNPSLNQHRILTVEGPGNTGTQAVTDTAGNPNTPGAVLLGGSLAARSEGAVQGQSDAIEFKTVTTQSGNQAVFGADENVDVNTGGTPDANAFGFHTGDGTIERGASIANVSGSNVTVQFDGTPPTSQAQRWFADTNDLSGCGVSPGGSPSVWDQGTAGPTGGAIEAQAKFNLLFSLPNNTTTAPDPLAAARSGLFTIDYTFDENLAGTINNLCFLAFEADGDLYEAESAVYQNPTANTIVRATFAAADTPGTPAEIFVAAGVIGDAVFSAADPGDGNTYGMFSLTEDMSPGFTDGFDLEQFTKDGQRGKYCGDNTDKLDPASIDDDDYFVLDKDGNQFQSDETVPDGTNCVLASFTDAADTNAVANAVAGGVDDDDTSTAEDQAAGAATVNNCNACATDDSFGSDDGNQAAEDAFVAVGGPPPTGPPGPPAPPGPPGPPPPSGLAKAKSTVTIHHGSPFNGKVKSPATSCKSKRKVTVFQKSPKDKVGSDKTNKGGKWKEGAGHDHPGLYYAKVKRKTVGSTICLGDRSRTIRVS